MSKSNNYIPFEIKEKGKIYHDSVSYPNDLDKIKRYSDFILKKAENFITSRANRDFYNRLKIYQVEVNYPESIEIKNYDDESLYELSNFNITYWIIYTYEKDKFQYAFGLEFDKDGKMISEQKFPEYSKNKVFENFTLPCDALSIVKSNKKFKNKKVDYIELAYLDEANSFCWLIEEERDPNKEFEKWEEKTVNLYYVNANSNKLEVVKEKTTMVIACGIGPLTKKGKRELRKKARQKKKAERN
ncbi:hypothetical protein ACFS5J_12405 [Flavobacterium chuncheonense]|uniref:Phage protein n=1 Tax=Flavobacterium chuncheonense TaxID=2026653 RepID=A0ABW5YQD4_9FLAO